MNSTSVINISSSLHKLTEGGTPILIAKSIKQKKIAIGNEILPLLHEITREWLEE